MPQESLSTAIVCGFANLHGKGILDKKLKNSTPRHTNTGKLHIIVTAIMADQGVCCAPPFEEFLGLTKHCILAVETPLIVASQSFFLVLISWIGFFLLYTFYTILILFTLLLVSVVYTVATMAGADDTTGKIFFWRPWPLKQFIHYQWAGPGPSINFDVLNPPSIEIVNALSKISGKQEVFQIVYAKRIGFFRLFNMIFSKNLKKITERGYGNSSNMLKNIRGIYSFLKLPYCEYNVETGMMLVEIGLLHKHLFDQWKEYKTITKIQFKFRNDNDFVKLKKISH